MPGIFGAQQKQYLEHIKQMLAQSLVDTANQSVRFSAVKATCAFILANEKDQHILSNFKDLVPHVLQVNFFGLTNMPFVFDSVLTCLL